MTDSNDPSLSRRKWLGLAAGASLGAGLLALTQAAEAQETKSSAKHAATVTQAHPATDHNLGARTYNIRDFGAKGDGATLDTAAVQAAIDACNKDQGGTVLVPAGVFLIGTIEMKSNVTLHIAAAGKLLGSADGKQYRAADAIDRYARQLAADAYPGIQPVMVIHDLAAADRQRQRQRRARR